MRMFCYMIPMLGFGIALESLYTRIPNDYSVKRKYLETKMKDVRILVLGSSLTWRGINPKYFSVKAYNASFAGQSFLYDELLFREYIDSCRSLTDVIICVSYGDFRNSTRTLFPARGIYYSKYFDAGSSHDFFITSRRGISMLSGIAQYYFSHKSFVESDSLGYKPSGEKVNIDFENNGKRVAEVLTNPSTDEIAGNQESLLAIIDECESRQIRVYLVTPPFSESLCRSLDKVQLEEMERICSGISRNRKNVFYFNFMDDPDFNQTDYLNTNHLNNYGAEKLTRKIDSLLRLQRNTKEIGSGSVSFFFEPWCLCGPRPKKRN